MSTLLTTIITSALVATVANVALNEWFENCKFKRSTRLDALSAAVKLEGYALTCANKIADHDLALSSEGHAGSYLGAVPELPELSIVVGFLNQKKARVANLLMIFPQEVYQADQYIDFWWDVTADHEIVRQATALQVAKLGLSAIDLAIELRRLFKLPARDMIMGAYDLRKTLETAVYENRDSSSE